MPRQTEPNANNALGELLRGMMQQCEVRSENTQTFPDHPGRHADVLITCPGRSPVVVEAEYEPASEVDKDARERLGLRVGGEPRTVEAAIALRYPLSVEEAYEVREAVAEARLFYYVLHQDDSDTPTRFPESGWLEGSVSDLADLVRLVSVPQREVDVAADRLQAGIDAAADILDQLENLAPAVPREVAQLLGMSDVPQTRRMACAIIANAMVFQERIAGIHDGVKPIQLVCGPEVGNPQAATLEAWTAILEINYWPIFRYCTGPAGATSFCTRRPDSGGPERHSPRCERRRGHQRPRPDRAHLPAPHRRPQVSGHLLHPPGVGGAPGPPGCGEAEGCGLG